MNEENRKLEIDEQELETVSGGTTEVFNLLVGYRDCPSCGGKTYSSVPGADGRCFCMQCRYRGD